MRTTPIRLMRALGIWLSVIGAILVVVVVAVWSYDPPWSVREVQGVVVSWGKSEAPNVVLRYHKILMLVRTDDGRKVSVSSSRRVPPNPGDRVWVEERVGLLGITSFVESPVRRK